jgi:TRAP-type C4-dicarboxylate transport system permease small subunit
VGVTIIINRSIIHYPIAWGDSLMRYSLVWIAFLGSTILLKEGKLISIDAIVLHLSFEMRQILSILSCFITILFLLIIFLKGVELTLKPEIKAQTVATLGISVAWIYLSIPFSAVIALIHAIPSTWQKLRQK